jgi:hypothetical protein
MNATLEEEFSGSGWEITVRPGGVSIVTAYRCSEDGRSRRFIAAPSATLLRDRLHAIEKEEDEGSVQQQH